MALAGLSHSIAPAPLVSGPSSSGQRPRAVRCAAFAAPPRNFYQVLGLPSQDVDVSSIKLAYRSMARQLHPDVCPREQLEECTRQFIVLQEAYETLSDPRRRAMHDLAISGGIDSHGIARWGMNQEFTSGDWKCQWSDQLWRLKRRSQVKESQNPESWAARMRRKREQDGGGQ